MTKKRTRVVVPNAVPESARREGEFLFVDRDGNVRAAARQVGCRAERS